MDVCMLSRSVMAHGRGGLERHIQLLGRELVRLGHRVCVLTTSHPSSPETERAEDSEGVQYRFLAGCPPGAYSGNWWKASREALSGMSPDIVHSQSIGAYGALGLIRKRRLPLVVTCHGTPISDAATKVRSFGPRTNPADLLSTVSRLGHHMKVYGAAGRVIAVGPSLAGHLSRTGLAPRQNIAVVLNGIDTAMFTPDNAPEKKEGPVIFSLARMVEEKGFQFLVRALPGLRRSHPSARLVAGGNGPFMPKLKALAVHEGVEGAVEFTGPIPDGELPGRYRACDLFAFATTHVEGLPLVLPEAMACGRPVAASRIGGIPDVVIEGSTGALFKPGDQEGVRRTLERLFSDPGLLKKMGWAAREDAVKRFSAPVMARRTVDVYMEVIGHRGER